MKKSYTIGEIASLYSMGADSLRYYEKTGLIKPTRSESGYREYDEDDIWKLNVIRDMLKLDYSTAEIKDYLDMRTIKSTLALFEGECSIIDREIEELNEIRRKVKYREESIKAALLLQNDAISIRVLPPRHIIRISGKRVHEYEIDMMVKKLHKRFESELFFIHSNDTGAIIAHEDIEKGVFNRYSCVFMTRNDDEQYDAILDGGEYVTVSYKGDYVQTSVLLPKMLEYAKAHHREVCGNALEMYLIDVHETADESEFITELQLPVKRI